MGHQRRPRRLGIPATLAAVAIVAGCSGGGPNGRDDDAIHVVTTVSPITNLAQNVGGDLVQITGIVPEGGFGDDFAFTPMFSQVVTDRFSLLVIPERLQFTPKVPVEEQKPLIVEKVGAFVRALPHTPTRPSA